jgi:hypothetical protein
MPLITTDLTVDNYCTVNNIPGNCNLLIIAENYPRPFGIPDWEYFYRSLYPFPLAPRRRFFNSICNNFGIPYNANELIMLNNFINGIGIGGGQRFILDALPHGALPIHPINGGRLINLIADIQFIDPTYILILHNRNIDTHNALIANPLFAPFIPRLVQNPLRDLGAANEYIFPYPAPPAPPNFFTDAINAARALGYNI